MCWAKEKRLRTQTELWLRLRVNASLGFTSQREKERACAWSTVLYIYTVVARPRGGNSKKPVEYREIEGEEMKEREKVGAQLWCADAY